MVEKVKQVYIGRKAFRGNEVELDLRIELRTSFLP
jgi:hypothetical protein